MRKLLPLVPALLSCSVLIACAGGGGGTNSTGSPDRPPGFALYDPGYRDGSSIHVLPAGTTAAYPISVISENGWKQPLNLQVGNIPAGWTATLSKTSYASLPAGVTTDTLTVTAPASAAQYARIEDNFYVTATSGGVTRKLNDLNYQFGLQGNPPVSGAFFVQVAGLSMPLILAGGNNACLVAPPLTDTTKIGSALLYGAGIMGPVTLKLINNNPGITATLTSSTVTPGTDHSINGSPEFNLHISSTLGHGAYPITLVATDAKDGYTAQATYNIDLCSETLDSALPALNLPSHDLGATGSINFGETLRGYAGQKINAATVFAHNVPQPVPSGVTLTISPATVTLPSSGVLDQQFTVTATVSGTVAAGSYPNCKVGIILVDDPFTVIYSLFTLNIP